MDKIQIKAVKNFYDLDVDDAFVLGKIIARLGFEHELSFKVHDTEITLFSKESLTSSLGLTEASFYENPEKYGVPIVKYDDITLGELFYAAIEHEKDILIGDTIIQFIDE